MCREPQERQAFLVRCEEMSERAEVCRKRMEECQRLAKATSDTAVRQMYLDLARQWHDLAEHAEQLEALQNRSR